MTKRFKEISSMGREELAKKLIEMKKELIKMDMQVATGTIPKNPSAIKNTRRMMARIIMLIEQKDKEKLYAKKTEGKKA